MDKRGYFQQTLLVYGHKGGNCPSCGTTIENVKINQRASVSVHLPAADNPQKTAQKKLKNRSKKLKNKGSALT